MEPIKHSGAGNGSSSDEGTETTGRYVVVFSDELQGDSSAQAEALSAVAGAANIASSLDFQDHAVDVDQTANSDATIFAELGVAVLQADSSQIVATAEDRRILAVEPERIFYAIDASPTVPLEYIRGYRDATAHLYDELSRNGAVEVQDSVAETFLDDAASTWGLKATKAAASRQDGKGIRVAVLDTGLDLGHPDFAGRPITHQSFMPGLSAQDDQGHGTHCAGTSCGPLSSPATRRYGVAHGADLFVGKVLKLNPLTGRATGPESGILAGMEWALANGCHVISMSLGVDIRRALPQYELIGRRALAAGALIIAAAGNNAKRSLANPGFVGAPANSPSIMAVAAVDNRLRVANFSAQSNPVDGGNIDIAGPGVAVHSSWPMATRYRAIDGTSMATPHVAGIAALWCKATGETGGALWSTLVRNARRLDLPTVDVGAGLVQAPA